MVVSGLTQVRCHRMDIEPKKEPLLIALDRIVNFGIRALAVLMTFVVVWALVDVIFHLYRQFSIAYESLFTVETLFSTLGSILAVLIAVEIFLNIVYFIVKDAVNVQLVLATALTAIARKVIIIDYSAISDGHLYATGALILSVGLVYWLVTKSQHVKS